MCPQTPSLYTLTHALTHPPSILSHVPHTTSPYILIRAPISHILEYTARRNYEHPCSLSVPSHETHPLTHPLTHLLIHKASCCSGVEQIFMRSMQRESGRQRGHECPGGAL